MVSCTRFKTAAGVGGVAAILLFTAAPAFAAGTPTGNEQITQPVPVGIGQEVGTVPYVATEDANGNPISSDLMVVGTGYSQNLVYTEECDGRDPTSAGWSPVTDCDPLTVTPPGGVTPAATGDFTAGAKIFRGVGPSDLFNCLAPLDNPNGSQVNVPNLLVGAIPAAIDPTVPSWGADTVGAAGGGTAPCLLRVTYNPNAVSQAGDKFFPIELPQSEPPVSLPESPLTAALPVGAVLLFGVAGAVLYRKSQSHRATD